MKTAENIGKVKGCTPGPSGVLKQHHAMASGYELPKPERRVHVPGLMQSGTGELEAPGLTHRGKRRRK